MTSPGREPAKSDRQAPAAVSELTVLLWLLAALIAEFVLACWFFGRLYAG